MDDKLEKIIERVKASDERAANAEKETQERRASVSKQAETAHELLAEIVAGMNAKLQPIKASIEIGPLRKYGTGLVADTTVTARRAGQSSTSGMLLITFPEAGRIGAMFQGNGKSDPMPTRLELGYARREDYAALLTAFLDRLFPAQ
jgi:hypothetical protein